ncbi:MAG: nicotinamide mononucleotide transporter [Tidjanibacter sp.]|nr:nicotinamide mononucleotide transporter [Tidjanibacter sp.]
MIWLELTGTLVGLIYLWLEYRASVWLWAANIVMPLIYIFVYYDSGFYADMGINVYYLVASLYGWIMWRRGRGNGKELPISHTPSRDIALMGSVFAVLMLGIWLILINFTDSTVPLGDTFTTALSVVALYMLAKKYVEQWLVWIVVDVVCVALYIYKGLYPTAILYLLYSVVAWFGYRRWLKMMKNDEILSTNS